MNNPLPTLALYYKEYCPYCLATRRVVSELALDLELRNIETNKHFRDELIQKGGKRQVPCLRIENKNGQVEWLYESLDINDFLRDYDAKKAKAA